VGLTHTLPKRACLAWRALLRAVLAHLSLGAIALVTGFHPCSRKSYLGDHAKSDRRAAGLMQTGGPTALVNCSRELCTRSLSLEVLVLCCTIAVRLVRVRRDKGSEDGAARLCNLHRPCVYHCRPTRTSPATATQFGGECDTHTRCDRLRTTLNNLRRASRAVDAVAGAASSLLADVDGAGRLACATGRRRRCAATYPNNSSATRGRIPRVLTYHGSPPTTSRLGYNTEFVLAPY
jgi:hypothetical protein